MIAHPRTGWQTLVADLSIILFMVSAGALAREAARQPAPALPGPGTEALPLAIYREAPGGPSLAVWLAGQQPDPRQQLTIVARYQPGREAAVPQRVATLLHEAIAANARVRILVEPGAGGTTAGLAFDAKP